MQILYALLTFLLVSFGAAIMSLEILASNLMSPYFGGSVYIWGSIISSFMVHLSLGYVLGGWLSKRKASLKMMTALLGAGSLWVILIPQISGYVCPLVADRIVDVRFGSLVAMNLIFFVPITLMATVSPFIIGLLPSSEKKGGFGAGLVMFISTAGSFIGTNATAFYLIDLFPVSRIIAGLGIYCLFVSITVAALISNRRVQAPN